MADTVEIDILARVDQAVSGIQDFITKIAAAYVSVEAFKKIVLDSFAAYEQAENAQVRLGAALQLTGQYSQTALAGLVSYSTALQNTSTFSHVATENAAALLLEIGHLSISGIQEIMPHLQDYASALGIDLVTAARNAAAAIEGGRNVFQRYGIDLKDSHDSTSRFDVLIQGLTKDFGGMSDAMSKTTSGQITMMTNQIDQLKQSYAGLIAQLINPVLQNINLGMSVSKIMETPATAFTDTTSLKNAIKLVQEEHDRVAEAVKEHLRWVGPDAQKDLADYSNKVEALQRQLSKMPTTAPSSPIVGGQTGVDAAANQKLIDEGMKLQQKDWNDFFAIQGKVNDGFEIYAKECLKADEAMKKLHASGAGKPMAEVDNLTHEVAQNMDTVAKSAIAFADALAAGDLTGFFQKLIKQAEEALVPMALLAAATAASHGDFVTMAVWLAIAGGTLAVGTALGPSSGGGSSNASYLPHMASGGMVTSPTVALIGESGPEAVIPLGKGAGGNTIIVQGSIWAAKDLAREIAAIQAQW